MTKKEFNSFWKSNYPETYPIGNELKWIYDKRWFRIHSLPESKRYAESEEEYGIIFERQNQLIDDLIGEGEEIIMLFGSSDDDFMTGHFPEITEFREFEKVDVIDLHKLQPEEHEFELVLGIFIKTARWKYNVRNDILKAIADDEMRMMFICPSKNRIIAPYDGGVDVILETERMRDFYKKKYKEWLSKHPERL